VTLNVFEMKCRDMKFFASSLLHYFMAFASFLRPAKEKNDKKNSVGVDSVRSSTASDFQKGFFIF
jgi:hypothetical protein